MPIRGIRGATTVPADREGDILQATHELLAEILQRNPSLDLDEIACVFFTVTDDLSAAFPARAAREMGWSQVPLMCAREIDVPGGLRFCIRILVQWNTDLPQAAMKHVYLGRAATLRPDLSTQAYS